MNVSLENILSILALIISAFSFWYSWYVSDRFGLKSKIYEKRLSAALDLIEAVKSINFNGDIRNTNGSFIGGISTTKFKKHFNDEYKRFKHIPVYFAPNEFNIIFKKLNELKSNPYLDKKIVKSLDFLDTSFHFVENVTKVNEFAVLTIKYNYQGHLINPIDFPTLKNYFDNMENVVEVTVKWLKQKSKLADDFNI